MARVHACVLARVHTHARQSLDGATVTLRLLSARRLRAQPDVEVDHGCKFVRFEKL